MGWDSNPRGACTPAGFQDRCLKPLGHPSIQGNFPAFAITARKALAGGDGMRTAVDAGAILAPPAKRREPQAAGFSDRAVGLRPGIRPSASGTWGRHRFGATCDLLRGLRQQSRGCACVGTGDDDPVTVSPRSTGPNR